MSTKISAMTAASTLDGSEKVEVVQAGQSKRTTTQEIANLATSASSVASAVTVTPSGNISSTDVQAALQELDTEKVATTRTINGHALSADVTVTKGDVGLGNVDNTSDVNKPVSTAQAAADTAALNAAKAYTDSAIVGGFRYRGTWDPSVTIYPNTGGSGSAGAVKAGDAWEMSVAGNGYDQGDIVVAKIDTPGQTAANWGTSEHNTQQATESVRGTAKIADQTTIQSESTTNDTDAVTAKKFWFGIARLVQLAWTWTLKQTFTTAPRFSSTTANQVLEVDANKDLVSAAKGSAYNKDFASDAETQTGTETAKPIAPARLAAWWTYIKGLAGTLTLSGNLKAKQVSGDWGALTDAATIAWDANVIGSAASVTITANRTLAAITNPQVGCIYFLRVIQDATGGWTLTFNAAYTFPAAVTPILNSSANQSTAFVFMYDGTSFRYMLPNGSVKFADLYLQSQAAASGEQRPLLIDNAGKVQKSAYVKYDETNKKTTWTGKDNLNTVMARFENSDLAALFEIFDDFTARFYGTVAFLTVPSTIAAGNAGIETQDITGIQFRLKDISSNDFFTIEKLASGKRISRFKKATILDVGVGMERYDDQIAFVTSATAAAQNVALSITIPTDSALTLKLRNVIAYATNGNLVGMKDLVVTAKNVAGTVTTGVVTVTSDPVPNTITGTFNININGTAIELRFQNDTGTGRTYTVFADYSYAIIPLPL